VAAAGTPLPPVNGTMHGGAVAMIDSIVFSSPADDLDVTVATVRGPYAGSKAFARRPPVADGKNCVYVLSPSSENRVVLSASLMLGYDTPHIHIRESGMPLRPGSGVFNRQWELVGLLRHPGRRVGRLDGSNQSYRAAEVTWIGAIRDAIASASPVVA